MATTKVYLRSINLETSIYEKSQSFKVMSFNVIKS